MKRVAYVLLLAVLMVVTVLSVSACKKEEEPLDVLIEVYDPYTNELMARQKNRDTTKPEVFKDTITMYKSKPRVVYLKFISVKGKETFVIDRNTVEIRYQYRYLPKPGESINYYKDKPITSSGMHHVSIHFNPHNDSKEYKSAEISFYYTVIEEE